MYIQNTPQINYYQNSTKTSTPTFQAKMQLSKGAEFFYNSDQAELDKGIIGFLRGKPFQKLMNKFKDAYPDQAVEFSYEQPFCYGFNYISGNGVAMSDAKLIAKNMSTNKYKEVVLDDGPRHPFYTLVDKVLTSKNFWNN